MSSPIRTFLLPIACLLWLSLNVSLRGEVQDRQTDGLPSDALKEVKRTGLKIVGLARTAQGKVRPGCMVVVRAQIANTGDKPAEADLVGKVTGFAGDEFRRLIRLDAKEERQFDLAIRVSSKVASKTVEISVTLNALENGREVMIRGREDETAFHTMNMSVVERKAMYALQMDPPAAPQLQWRWPATVKPANYEHAIATAIDAGVSREATMIDTANYSINIADSDALDLLIISDPYAFNDAATVQNMQQFLKRGGRIWIMADRIDTAKMRDLLQPGQQCETLDVIERSRMVIDVHAPNALSVESRTLTRDQPVTLKRILQKGGRVSHSTDGWPIAIWFPVDRGEILVTALSSDAWLEPVVQQRSSDPVFQSNFKLPVWAGDFSTSAFDRKPIAPFASQNISYPLELIGSPIVSFRWVGTVLFGFCGVLTLFGLWRIASGNLNWMGAFAPIVACAACIPLVGMAIGARNEVPSMVSKLQFVQIGVGGGILHEQAAVYCPENHSMKLSSDADGIAKASENVDSGVRVVESTGFHAWSLSNENWPAGTFRYQTETSLPSVPVVAKGQLSSNGLSLELYGKLPSQLEDVVLNFGPGSLAIGTQVSNGKRWLFDGTFEASSDRWTSDTFITTEQLRRASAYRDLFMPTALQPRLPARTIYGWTELWENAPKWNTSFETRGAALVGIPVEIEVPEIGTEVKIPYSLVTVAPRVIGKGVTALFNPSTGRWVDESTLNSNADISITLPPEALPLEATSVDIDWDIRAPRRKVRLLHRSNGNLKELVMLSEPSVPWQSTIKDPELLRDLRDGVADFQIEVTDLNELEALEANSFVSWRIKHFRVSVHGKTLPLESRSASPSTNSTNSAN